MTKQYALSKTQKKFTNLMDGKVVSHATVSSIIDYYESMLSNTPAPKTNRLSGIEQNFIEDEINEYITDEDNEWGI